MQNNKPHFQHVRRVAIPAVSALSNRHRGGFVLTWESVRVGAPRMKVSSDLVRCEAGVSAADDSAPVTGWVPLITYGLHMLPIKSHTWIHTLGDPACTSAVEELNTSGDEEGMLLITLPQAENEFLFAESELVDMSSMTLKSQVAQWKLLGLLSILFYIVLSNEKVLIGVHRHCFCDYSLNDNPCSNSATHFS